MGSGLIQLVSYGKENLYLSGDPQITFFKIAYKRYTNFSIEAVAQYFKNVPDFGKRVTCSISKNADLLGDIMLQVTLPSIPQSENVKIAWVRKIGLALIRTVEIEIGGQIIDRQYGDWMNIWFELNPVKSNSRGFNKMIGNVKELTEFSNGKESYQLFIPLTFWFCFSKGLSLPIVSMQYNEIKIYLEFNDFSSCFLQTPTNYIDIQNKLCLFQKGEILNQQIDDYIAQGEFVSFDSEKKRLYYRKITNGFLYPTNPSNLSKYFIYGKTNRQHVEPVFAQSSNNYLNIVQSNLNPSLLSANLLVNYIYLDTKERFRFLKSNHEYLITQIQSTSEITVSNSSWNIKLPFLNPCCKLFWRNQMFFNFENNDLFNYTTGSEISYKTNQNIFKKGNLVLNGVNRFEIEDSYYFDKIQIYENFVASPSKGINVYSFSLSTKLYQPSGTCNFTQFDEIRLDSTFRGMISETNKCRFRAYAVTYNVLRIIDGFGGLVFDYY